jgi:uncharacterized protein (TIGR03437 family)
VLISALTCNPPAINANTSTSCAITLSQKVSAAGSVAVSTSNAKLSVPTVVSVPAGSAAVTFTGTVGGVDYSMVTLTAALNGLSQTAQVSIGIVPLASLTCAPGTLTAGASATCSFTLVSAAPAGGETINISSSSAKLSVPSPMAVAVGATSGSFTVTALSGYAGPVTVSAKAGGTKALTATISSAAVPKPGQGNARPGPVTSAPPQLSCSPKLVVAGSTVTCQLQLAAAAVSSATEVALSASHASIHLPSLVQSRPRQSTVSFQAYVDPAAPTQTVTLQATAGEVSVEERLSVQASGKPVLSVPGKQYVAVGKTLAFQVEAASGAGAVTVLAHALPSGARFDSSTGLFEWTPSAPGTERVTFSASDITQTSTTADVAIQAGDGTPVVESLENAASGSREAVCSSGGLATVRGGWLSKGTAADPSGESLQIGGTQVLVNGGPVAVVLASPTAVSFACPEAGVGTTLSVAIQTAAGRSVELTTVMRDSALGVFPMARDARNAGEPAEPGDVLQIAVTGLPVDADPALVTVQLGDVPVQAEWIRSVAGVMGVTQIGITLPGATPVGDSVPFSVQLHLPTGQIATSQTAHAAIEVIRH